ncbi:MAG: zinc-dependent alcohol dehydrogenase family protein [Herpetosiphon sp.]
MRTRSAVLYHMGRSRPYAHSLPLVIEEVELEAPGRGEVLVEIAAAGLCHSDLSVLDGSRPRVIPMVMGHEASGIVREIGPDVYDLRSGDHVVFSFVPMCGRCRPCLDGRPALCENGARSNIAGTLLGGRQPFQSKAGVPLHHHLGVSAFGEYTVAAQESLVKIDANMPLHVAALFGCAVMTGVGAVVNTARVSPGESVAVFGLGGVGLSVVMGARAAGAWPIIAVDPVVSKHAVARLAGASEVIDPGTHDPVQVIKELTAGGAMYTFESVGNEQVLAQAYSATRRGGTTVTIGLPHPSKQFSISAVSLVAEERVVKGSYMGSAVPQRDIPRFIGLYRAGLLPVELLHSGTIELDDINSGFDALASGTAIRQLIQFNAAKVSQ